MERNEMSVDEKKELLERLILSAPATLAVRIFTAFSQVPEPSSEECPSDRDSACR